MSRVFTREEFYELVWSKPMNHLAKKFALSDVALHKICRKHEIPNPPLGWWAKKAAGKPVKQTSLPRLKNGVGGRITIAGGELRQEPDLIAAARDNARVLASAIDADGEVPSNPIVERTAEKLRKAKPAPVTRLVSVEGAGLIKAEVAPASVDRLELALNRTEQEQLGRPGFRLFAATLSWVGLSSHRTALVRAEQCYLLGGSPRRSYRDVDQR